MEKRTKLKINKQTFSRWFHGNWASLLRKRKGGAESGTAPNRRKIQSPLQLSVFFYKQTNITSSGEFLNQVKNGLREFEFDILSIRSAFLRDEERLHPFLSLDEPDKGWSNI